VQFDALGTTLFNNAPAPLLLVDPDSDRILDANGAAVRLIGLEDITLRELKLAQLIERRTGCESQSAEGSSTPKLTAEFLASSQAKAEQQFAFHSISGNEVFPKPRFELRSPRGGPVQVELGVARAEMPEGRVILVVIWQIAPQRRTSEVEQLLHDSPVALFEYDWSGVRQLIREWEASGVSDIPSLLRNEPDRVIELARRARLVNLNRGALRMYGADSLDDFRDNLATIFGKDSLDGFRRHVEARLKGINRVELENINYTLAGDRIFINLVAVPAPGSSDSWERIYGSAHEITHRKRAEMLRDTQRQVLESLVNSVDISETLNILIKQVEQQSPELRLALFRLDSDRQIVELADSDEVPPRLLQQLDGRHWHELKPMVENWRVHRDGLTDWPVDDDSADDSGLSGSLLARLEAIVLAEGFCDGCLKTAKNALGEPLGLLLVLRQGTGPFRDYENEIIASARRLTAIALDHERDHQQIRLRTGELQSLFEAYPDVLLRLTSDGTIVEKLGGDLLGLLSPGDTSKPVGSKIWTVLPACNATRLIQAIEQVNAGSGQETVEFRYEAADVAHSLEARVVPLTETGELLAILRDVTVLKRTEQALEYASERFRNLFESSPDAIFVVSLDGELLDVNPAACELHGMPREELPGRSMFDLVPERLHARLHDTSREIQSRGCVSFDGCCLDSRGEEISVDIRGTSVRFDGHPALLYHVRDATQRLDDERRRREHERQMAHVSRLSLMGQFVAGIAHEIRQPLWSIGTFAEVAVEALERPDAVTRLPQIRDLSEKIVREVRRVNDITSRMFSFARKSIPERATVPVQDIIETAAVLCQPALADRSIRLTQSLPGEPINVWCDRVLIEQTIINLLTNAGRAISNHRTSGGLINISLASNARFAHISVTDNGSGLPENMPGEQLFEGFFSTDRAGLGIGLALSRSFVEDHGGRIWAEPNSDCGMAFHFTLSLELEARGE
jgi:PAS domain S-box-containing protein